MERIPIWVLLIFLILFLHKAHSVEEEVRVSLIKFLQQLSNGSQIDPRFGWSSSSDPCDGSWKGIECTKSNSVKKIVLEGKNFSGILDATSLCTVQSLVFFSVKNNHIYGEIPSEISNCKKLTHLLISGNRFTGNLPLSLSHLNNLKRLDIAQNNFYGELSDISKISGLVTFLAQNNGLSGRIPEFDFSNLEQFNVSYNNFSGPVPDLHGRFNESSFYGNPELCGEVVAKQCPLPLPPLESTRKKGLSVKQVIMYLGYVLLGLVLFIFLIYRLTRQKKASDKKIDDKMKGFIDGNIQTSNGSNVYKSSASRSEFSIPSASESVVMSSSLVVLRESAMNELKFEDLLRAPAELLGRGRYGSIYKVMLEDGATLAVKRIKDWAISSDQFRRRMEIIDRTKHTNVLPVLAFYGSKQEKLVVYEYQQNGSLFNLLHGSQRGQAFDWVSRLSSAASIANGLAFMHKELNVEGIAHGNLKSSNIMMNKHMDSCISEYGLMELDNQNLSSLANGKGSKVMDRILSFTGSTFKADTYGYGIILLELLTGKLVQNNGFDLARWVHSVVREEWTVEVFDRGLMTEGASEERMVNLLQVALKCINHSPEARPDMNRVADMVNIIKEDEERSIVSET